MKSDKIDRDESMLESETQQEPRVFAIKRGEEVWRNGKRAFLKGALASAVIGVVGCSESASPVSSTPKTGEKDDSDDSPPPNELGPDALRPFVVNSVTYRRLVYPNYNAELPSSAANTVIVASVGIDYYFRSFDAKGAKSVDIHESKAVDQSALAKFKTLSQAVVLKRTITSQERVQFAELVATTTGASGSGRRMQAAETSVSTGRRLQGSTSPGPASGRRIQGAEGRPEAQVRRNLGTLIMNNERYDNAKIVDTYTDGYTRLSHAGGEVVVRTDSLPELVRLQTPMAIANPVEMPSAVPRSKTTTTVVPAPTPVPRSSPPRSYGHYWRPN